MNLTNGGEADYIYCMTTELTELYIRDIDKAIEEISLYKSEADLWKVAGDVTNSAGNLAMHLAGNLLHYVGALLGGTDYKRDRDFEFAGKDVSRDILIANLTEAKEVISRVLPNLKKEQLDSTSPKNPFDMTTRKFLFHLYSHFSYHLGQINYHRRLISTK